MVDGKDDGGGAADDVGEAVASLLRLLSEIDMDELGEDLRELDSATSQRALTGVSLLAEAITRAVLGADGVADVLGVDLDQVPEHTPHTQRGERIVVHDDDAEARPGTGSGA